MHVCTRRRLGRRCAVIRGHPASRRCSPRSDADRVAAWAPRPRSRTCGSCDGLAGRSTTCTQQESEQDVRPRARAGTRALHVPISRNDSHRWLTAMEPTQVTSIIFLGVTQHLGPIADSRRQAWQR